MYKFSEWITFYGNYKTNSLTKCSFPWRLLSYFIIVSWGISIIYLTLGGLISMNLHETMNLNSFPNVKPHKHILCFNITVYSSNTSNTIIILSKCDPLVMDLPRCHLHNLTRFLDTGHERWCSLPSNRFPQYY